MSKNNAEEISKRTFNQSHNYALRKLSVGVVSVLIGTTMYAGLAHADTVVSNDELLPIEKTTAPPMAQSAGDSAVTSLAPTQLSFSHNLGNGNGNEARGGVQTNNNQAQPTNFINVNKVAAVYSANKVSQPSVSNQAENAQLDFYNWNITGSKYDDPVKLNNGNPLPWGRVIYFNARGSFDLTEAQLKSTQLINIGTLKCTQSPVNVYPESLRVRISRFPLRTSDGVTVGEYLQTPGYLAVRLNGTYQGTGSQHFEFSDVDCEDGYLASTQQFRGHGAVPTTVTYQVGTHVYQVKVAAPQVPELVTQAGVPELSVPGWSYGDAKLNGDIQFSWHSASRLNNSQLQTWVKSGGMSIGSASYPDADKPFEYAFKLAGDDTLTPSWIHIEKRANALDSQGRMHDDHGTYFVNTYGGNAKNSLDDEYVIDNAGDGLSLEQLKQMQPNNVSGAVIYWSRQADGSALVYVKMPATDMKIKNFDTLRSALNSSPTINLDSDPDKAIANTMDYYEHRNVMGGYPYSSGWTLWCTRADDTKDTRTAVTYYDPATGQPLNQNPVLGLWKTNKTAVKGQATVKLHVISSTGVALQPVQSFTDWPDQNKHATLTMPSITGYHLVTDPQAVLASLHLTGTAISAATQAAYPAENTVADYYVVMAPDTETVQVKIVDTDADATLATYTLSGLYGAPMQATSAMATQLQSLLASGKYDLVANPLTNMPKYGTTNNPITISLKHHLDSTQRHYRVVEELPDGTQKVILDVKAVLYKDANVKYYIEQGAKLNGTGKILKLNEYRILAGQMASSLSDNSDVVAAVDVVPGYTATLVDSILMYQDGVHAALLNDGRVRVDVFNGTGTPNDPASGSCAIDLLSSRDFYITYSRRSYPVTVSYYDLSGKLVDLVISMHKFGDRVSIAPVVPANYVLVNGQAKTDHLVGLALNEIDFLVEPKLTQTTETKTVSRTIKVQTPDGQTQNVVQTVKFLRNGYVNQVTKQPTYSPWSFGGQYRFSGYRPKPIDGYTADVVPTVVVTPDSLDTTVNVAYHKQVSDYSVVYQLANGMVVKKVSVTPGNDGRIQLTAPVGYRLMTSVTDVQVGHTSQNLVVLVTPDARTYTAKDTLPGMVMEPLTKAVTRKVVITMPNGRTRTVTQTVRFERTATVNADGTVSYSNWQAIGRSQFSKVFIPKRHGYHLVIMDASGKVLPGVVRIDNVTAAMSDEVVSVQYVQD